MVNGDPAPKGQFPYLGFLQVNECAEVVDGEGGACGASLITPRAVLTAGHCLYQCSKTYKGLPKEVKTPYGYQYTYGEAAVVLNRYNLSKFESGTEFRPVTRIVRHPLYKRDSLFDVPAQYDMALMLLDRASKVTPIRLNTNPSFTAGTKFQVAGWGATDPEGDTYPDVPYYASVPYVSLPTCSEALTYDVWSGNVCAGGAEDKADTCVGDSGGPMVMNGDQAPAKHKLVSGKRACFY